jgi:hypothetical protein
MLAATRAAAGSGSATVDSGVADSLRREGINNSGERGRSLMTHEDDPLLLIA